MTMDKEELLHMFIGAHITKDLKDSFKIMYDGRVDNLGITIDSNMAMDWRRLVEKSVELKDYTIKFLGDVVKVNIPIFKNKKE